MADTKKSVLIVEDDFVLADVMANKLKLNGFDATHVSDGQQAVDVLDKKNFSIVLLDLQLPWFDGFQVLEDLKNKNFKTPIIITSNLAGMEDINRAKFLGAADYLVKTSVTPELIVKEIQKFIK
ncbi:MAG TPA: response regulator [Patescibacteria group bacterium]